MPWDATPNAGFTTGEPWLPLNVDWPTRNVAAQDEAEGSMLRWHQGLLAARRAFAPLRDGDLELLPVQGTILSYRRTLGDTCWTMILNLADAPARWEGELGRSTPMMSSLSDRLDPRSRNVVNLRPNEGVAFA